MPYIDDDGFILYESRAICRYIALKYADQGTKLIPTDLKGIALFEQAASIELSNFSDLVERAVHENYFKPTFYDQTADPVVFEGLIQKLDVKLDAYEKILGKQRYLAGDEVTLADLFHIPYGVLLAPAGSDILDRKPNVARQVTSRWFKDITSRPSWIAIQAEVKSTA
ncbi:hypothetical protein H0H92_013626 [Tricholoma furcatifolium]|nr:hypothetical protein H0H92_013626 [Tricholoma furcatifolium]